jgi:hypothetical protein
MEAPHFILFALLVLGAHSSNPGSTPDPNPTAGQAYAAWTAEFDSFDACQDAGYHLKLNFNYSGAKTSTEIFFRCEPKNKPH